MARRYIPWTIEPVLRRAVAEFPAVVLTGPRQSGKTTLLKHLFGGTHRYVSLEPPDVRAAAAADPRAFLEMNPPPVIFDEAQYAPNLLPYIKEVIPTDDASARLCYLLLRGGHRPNRGREHRPPPRSKAVRRKGAASSLDEVLIKHSVPERIYRRGLRYFRDRRVFTCEEEDGVIFGLVDGSEDYPYRTTVRVQGHRLVATCTCRYGGPVCKHAVALALHAMRTRGPGAGAGGRGERASPDRPPSDGRGPAAAPTERPGPAPWDARLNELLAEPRTLVRPEVGRTYPVCRLFFQNRGLAILFTQARFGKRGLGQERPVSSWWTADPPPASFRDPPYLHLLQLLHVPPNRLLSFYQPVPVPAAATDACLELLARLPFVYLGDNDQPLRFAPPLRGELELRAAGDGFVLTAAFSTLAGEAWQPPSGAGAFLTPGRLWVAVGATFHPVASSCPPHLLWEAAINPLPIPRDGLVRFLGTYLPRLRAAAAPVTLPPGLADRLRADLRPRPVLALSEEEEAPDDGESPPHAAGGAAGDTPAARGARAAAAGDGDGAGASGAREAAAPPWEGAALLVDLLFAYGDGPAQVRARAAEPEVVEAIAGSEVCWARRDRAAEEEAAARLEACGLERAPNGRFRARGEAALDFLRLHLPALAGEWEVRGQERLRRLRVARAKPRSVVRLALAGDWLDLDLALEWEGGRVGGGEVWTALLAGRRYVHLADGTALPLPEAWLRLGRETAADLGAGRERLPGGRLRLRCWDAALADAWLEAADERQADPAWHSLAALLRGFRGISPAPLPASLHGELRPYQREGYYWLSFLRDHGLAGVLADDMGLGKTVQALALLLAEKESGRAREPSLLVVPTSLVFNWLDEARRFAPGLRVVPLVGPGRHRLLADLDGCDLAITTYALLRRDAEALAGRLFHYLILDEAQHIKNPASHTARAAKALRARHRLALTGTPVENNLTELWSLFDFLLPGFLGSLERFTQRYARPIQEGEDAAALARLRRRIYPFILRRTKEQVTPELPPRTESVLTCELTPAQRRLYREVLAACRERVFAAVAERGIAGSHLTILDALLRLRQVCCHPRLVGLPGNQARTSAKLDLFRELVGDLVAGGHRVLVFSQFVEMLAILREELEDLGIAYEYLDGRTRDREARVKRFQEGQAPVFLISLRAGGTGLNLTAASYVIHYDPWWNPAVEEQAAARAHRIGQDKPVIAYRLVTRGTVEEKILELQRRKRALTDGLLAADDALGKRLTREDLEHLFRLD